MGKAREIARTAKMAGEVMAHPDLLWVTPGHFYSPITTLAERAEAVRRSASTPAELPGIDLRVDEQLALVAELAKYYGDLPWSDRPTGRLRYGYENTYLALADGIVYALMLRHLRPKRVVEVGSGWSSALGLDVDELFLDGATRFDFVEPYPDRLLELARPGETAGRLHQSRLQDAPMSLFTDLDAGDVLFVDSTHVSKSGSDVNHLFFEVLPALRPGVHVHIHDVFWPFEYPSRWLSQGRCWTEDYLLRAFLQFNTTYEISLFPSYLQDKQAPALAEHLPRVLDHSAGSIWLRRTP